MRHGRLEQGLNDALDLIGEAALREDLWDNIPNALARLFRAKTVAIYFQDERQRSGQIEQIETVVTEGYDGSTLDSYARYYHALNPYHRHPDLGRANRIITDEWLPEDLSDGEREYLEDWVRPQGVRHLMGQVMNRRAAGTLFLATWREGKIGKFDEYEKRVFGQVLRATDRAIQVIERVRTAEAAFSVAATQLGAQGVGVVILSTDGRVTDCNAVADACFANQDGLILRGGRLETLDPASQSDFQRFVRSLTGPYHLFSGGRNEIMLGRAPGRPPLRVEGVYAAGHLSRLGPNLLGSVVLLLHLPAYFSPSLARLRDAWDLTPGQAQLAFLLLEAVPLSEAARRLGVTRETARTHLKALFAKTNTHSQTELVLRLISGVT